MIWIAYLAAMAAVIGGHCYFAYLQWFKWKGLAERLTDLRGGCIESSKSLGRSFASYNASIAVGLALSFALPDDRAISATQGVVLALIVATAAVGASGTKGKVILLFRLMPALIALGLLLLSRLI